MPGPTRPHLHRGQPLPVGASGGASTEVVTLLTAEQVDAAAKMTVGYTPPGG